MVNSKYDALNERDSFIPHKIISSTILWSNIDACPKEVVPLLKELRAFVHSEMPGASEDMQYGAPSFMNAHGVAVIYLFGSKHHVNFGFLRCSGLSDPDGVLKVNDKLRLIPGHCDPTANVHDWYVGVRGGKVETLWPVSARGKAY